VAGAAVCQSLPFPDRDETLVPFRFCHGCSALIPLYPRLPADDELAHQADYHYHLWEHQSHVDLDLDVVRARVLAREIADFVQNQADGFDHLHEIGFGRGNLLFALRRRGFQVAGCEPSIGLFEVGTKAYALDGKQFFNGDAFEYIDRFIPPSDEPVGLIFWHVLEHMVDPMATLTKCRNLRSNAWYFIELPVAIQEDVFPEHLVFPTPMTLTWLAEQLELAIYDIGIVGDMRLRATLGPVRRRVGPNDHETESKIRRATVDYLRLSEIHRSFIHRDWY
jgi:hypothetical protein